MSKPIDLVFKALFGEFTSTGPTLVLEPSTNHWWRIHVLAFSITLTSGVSLMVYYDKFPYQIASSAYIVPPSRVPLFRHEGPTSFVPIIGGGSHTEAGYSGVASSFRIITGNLHCVEIKYPDRLLFTVTGVAIGDRYVVNALVEEFPMSNGG